MAEETKTMLPVTAAQQEEEVEIDLAKLFACLLRRWKSLVVAGLVGAVAVAALGYALDLAEATPDYSDEAYEELTRELTNAEIEEVESLYATYLSYQEQIAQYEEKYESNYLLTLTAGEVVTYVVEYAYTSNYPGTVSSFSTQTLGSEEYTAIAQIMGIEDDLTSRSVSEVLSIYGSESSNTYEFDLEGEEAARSGSVSEAYTGKLYFEVLGPDLEICEQAADVVRDAIQAHLEAMQAAGIEITLTEVSSNLVDSGDSTVLSAYQSAVSKVASLRSTLYDFVADYVDELSGDQTDLYDFLVARDGEAETKEVYLSKKMAVLGFVIGVVLLAMVYVVLYLLDGSIKDGGEAAGIVGRPVLAVVRAKKEYRGLNGLFERWADQLTWGDAAAQPEGQKRLLQEQIAAYAGKCGVRSVFVIADPADEKTLSLLEEIKAGDALQGLALRQGNPSADGADFAALKESGLAVVFVRVMETQRQSAAANTLICRELGKDIAGVVVVGEL